MKCVIEIFENGVRSDVLVTDDEYDWTRCSKAFSDKKDSYFNKGYKIVSESLSSECLYNVLFNEDEMKSAVVSAKFHKESDFIDADGQPIILSKLYRSEENGGSYSINKSCLDWGGRIYLRNSHIVTVNGRTQTSRTISDRYDFDQNFIDRLKLHIEKDKND